MRGQSFMVEREEVGTCAPMEFGCHHGNHNGAVRMTGIPPLGPVNNRYALILIEKRRGGGGGEGGGGEQWGLKVCCSSKQEMSIRGTNGENKNRQMGKDNCI